MGRLAIDVAGSSNAMEVIDICLQFYYDKMTGGHAPNEDGLSSHGFQSNNEENKRGGIGEIKVK